jgi:hypothetical protein
MKLVHEVVSPNTLGIYETFSSLKGGGGGGGGFKGGGSLYKEASAFAGNVEVLLVFFRYSSIPLNLQLSGVKILKVHKEKLRLNLNYLNTQVLFSNSPMTEHWFLH